jgi:hypothetical protein
MPIGEGVFSLAILAVWIYCIFDVIRTEPSRVENLPKILWLAIVVFLPAIGSIAWLLLGRPRGAPFRLELPTSSHPAASPHPSTQPQPPPTISSEEHQRRREEALRRHEAELAAREETLRRQEELRREEELRRGEQSAGDDPEPT